MFGAPAGAVRLNCTALEDAATKGSAVEAVGAPSPATLNNNAAAADEALNLKLFVFITTLPNSNLANNSK